MKRLTTDTPKNNLQAALNLFYIKDYETWVRGYGPAPEYADVCLFGLTRDIVKTHIQDVELPEDDDDLSNMMPEWLMDGIDSAEGIVALLYTAAWAYAELRHKLMRYEDTGLEPEEVTDLMAAHGTAIGKLTEYRTIGSVDYLRDLIRNLSDKKVCSSCYYDDARSCPDGVDIHECGKECFGCVCGECEGGNKFRPKVKLAEKDSAAPDAPVGTSGPEWKSRVMRTFLGGR